MMVCLELPKHILGIMISGSRGAIGVLSKQIQTEGKRERYTEKYIGTEFYSLHN